MRLIQQVKTVVRSALPEEWYRSIARRTYPRYCPICRQGHRRFATFGDPPRPEARCPSCGSLERHRLVWLYFHSCTDLFDGRYKRMLHIAPESCLMPHLKSRESLDYVSGDLDPQKAVMQVDVTKMDFADDIFDVIYCSHVLEHVPDDRLAMSEFHRVLKPGGWAILQVPINAAATYDDPSVTDPTERRRLFGQHDHVRVYGPDYRLRLGQAGFDVEAVPYAERVGRRQARKFGLDPNERVYYCLKPANGTHNGRIPA